jgi:hypothetical protein
MLAVTHYKMTDDELDFLKHHIAAEERISQQQRLLIRKRNFVATAQPTDRRGHE